MIVCEQANSTGRALACNSGLLTTWLSESLLTARENLNNRISDTHVLVCPQVVEGITASVLRVRSSK